MNYFKYIGFQNISEAQFVLAKAKKENYPTDFIDELETKIQGYKEHVERDGAMFK